MQLSIAFYFNPNLHSVFFSSAVCLVLSRQKKCLAASFVIFVNIMRCFINMQCANVVLFRGTPCTLYFFFFKFCFKISYLCFCKLFNLIWQLYRIILYVFNSCVKISKFVWHFTQCQELGFRLFYPFTRCFLLTE